MRNYSINNTVWKNRGHELDWLASTILSDENEFYIVGDENEMRFFYERTGSYIKQVKAFVLLEDHFAAPGNTSVIIEEDVKINEYTMIICATKNRTVYEMLKQRWKRKGFEENKNFFHGELVSMIYDVYGKNQIRLDRVEIFLTSRCTLNCEKCISYIPYFRKKEDTTLEQLKQDADILFHKVDYVYKLKLLGGEGLLYPNLIEYIDYLCHQYKENIGSIRIGTNGTILPGQDILDMCRRNHVTMDISDYVMAVPDRCKLDEVKELCEKYGVTVEIKRTGEQWLDLGFPNNIHRKEDEEQIRKHFYGCAMFCRQFYQGKMWFCCTNFAAVQADLFPENENDYFDFNTDFSKQELLEYELGYSQLGRTTFCRVCGGCSEEINSCKVEVAKQIK